MEAATEYMVSRITTLMVLYVVSYGLITVTVHYGLRSVMPDKASRQTLVQLLAVVAFGGIGYAVLRMQ